MDNHSRDEVAQQAAQVAAVFKSINMMSVGVAALLSTGMIVDRHSVTVSVLSGVGFYGAIAGLLILWQPGALPHVLTHRQHEVTERRRDELHYKLTQSPQSPQSAQKGLQVVEYPQIGREPSVAPARLSDSPRFVPAVPDINETARVDAYNFVCQLFDRSTGKRIPTKITKNKWQIQHPSPTQEAVDYLMALGIVRHGEGNQLYYNLDEIDGYPTLQEAINAIRTGVRPSPWRHGKGEEEEGI